MWLIVITIIAIELLLLGQLLEQLLQLTTIAIVATIILVAPSTMLTIIAIELIIIVVDRWVDVGVY